MFYTYEIRESDGNDTTVYDAVIEAESREEADRQLSDHFHSLAEERGWEHDGNFCGYYFPCDCEVPELPAEEIPCPQCEMVAVNGIPVHEAECPVDRKRARIEREIDRWECPGHGGLTVSDEAGEFASEEEAEQERSPFHARYWM